MDQTQYYYTEPVTTTFSDWSNTLIPTLIRLIVSEKFYRRILTKWHRLSMLRWSWCGGYNFDNIGLSGDTPFNSMYVTQQSLQNGACQVSIDLTRTKDKRMIASHADTWFPLLDDVFFRRPTSSLDAPEARKLMNPWPISTWHTDLCLSKLCSDWAVSCLELIDNLHNWPMPWRLQSTLL